MIVTMEVATEIEIVLTAERTNMGAVIIAMLVTETLLVGIAFKAIGMEAQIVTLRMVMAKTKGMIEMVAHAGAVIGMEVEEDQQGMREEVTGTGRLLMSALTGQRAHRPLTATRCS